jgi:hypothetical protein
MTARAESEPARRPVGLRIIVVYKLPKAIVQAGVAAGLSGGHAGGPGDGPDRMAR